MEDNTGFTPGYSFGQNTLKHCIKNIFDRINLTATIKLVSRSYIVCAQVNLEDAVCPPPLLKPIQSHRTYP